MSGLFLNMLRAHNLPKKKEKKILPGVDAEVEGVCGNVVIFHDSLGLKQSTIM